jgi:hypothetical protein
MKLPPDILRTGVLRIDWSGFSRILECHRKAWHLLCHRRELDGFAPALTYGRAIHEGLDVWQKAIMRGSTDRPTILTDMEAAAEREFSTVELPEDEWRHLGRAKEVLGLYLDERWDEDRSFKILESEKYHHKELGHVHVEGLGEITITWQGKIDGIWSDPRNGAIAVKDSKTSSHEFEHHGPGGGPGRDAVRYQQSGQFMGYCFLTGATSALVDSITCLKPLQRMTAKSAPRNQFERIPFEWSPEQISEWQHRTLFQIQQWLEALLLDTPASLMNTNACAWPTVCTYYSACEQKTEEMRLRWLSSGRFRDYTWDPSHKNEETA